MYSEATLNAACELAVVKALKALGLTAGEMSAREARRTYGGWFDAQVAAGTLRPVSIGAGRNGTIRYDVEDILALKAEQHRLADIQITQLNHYNNGQDKNPRRR